MRRLRALLALIVIFPRELWHSSVAVLVAALSKEPDVDPAVIKYPLKVQSDGAIVTLANLISLTPGTTSLHVSADRKHLYIHALQAQDEGAIVSRIEDSFERWLLEVESR